MPKENYCLGGKIKTNDYDAPIQLEANSHCENCRDAYHESELRDKVCFACTYGRTLKTWRER